MLDKKRKQVGEFAEKLDAIGQDNEKEAAKWVIEEGKLRKAEDDKFEQTHLEKLEKKSKYQFLTYKMNLAQGVGDIVKSRDSCPKGYKWDAWADGGGVGLQLWTPDNRHFYRAFKPINIPKYDFHACFVLVLQMENLIDRLEKQKETTYTDSTGIILPK